MASINELFADAQSHHHAGHFAEAQRGYEAVLREAPRHADALNLLGTVLAQQGDAETGVGFIVRAIEAQPNVAAYYNNLGVLRQDLNQLELARQAFEQARAADPNNTDPVYNLAKLYKQLDQTEAAIFAYLRVLEIDPGRVDAMINLGNIFFDDGRLDEAIEAFRKAAESDAHPTILARARINLGNTYRRMGQDRYAIADYDEALRLDPHDGLRIKRALTLPVVMEDWPHIHATRAAFANRIEELRQENLSVTDPALETSTTTFFLAYHAEPDGDLQEQVAALHLQACPSLAMVAPHCEQPHRREGRIKLGLISAYFRLHSIGRLMRGIIDKLDREIFEVTVFTQPGQRDELAKFINQRADNLVSLPTGFDEARAAVADAKQDILFYADLGMDVRTYFMAFARLAPIQCVTWGHPDTTGIPNIDYFISSDLIEAEGADDHYSETLYQLKTLPTCYSRPEPPTHIRDRESLGLPADKTIYLCPQSAIKFHPDMDQVVARILAEDGNAVFQFLEGTVADWTRQFRQRIDRRLGNDAGRIEILPRVSPDDFLNLLAAADVVVDTPHFSGGNTSYEAFAMGTPIAGHAGKFMRGRVTLGQYKMMEMEHLVANDVDGIAEIALRLGLDKAYRDEICAQLNERSDQLFDETEAVDEFEAFFRSAYDAIAG